MTVEKAAAFATKAHEGQIDKSGLPVIWHPQRVAAAVAEHGPLVQTVAWLHDVVEDCGVTVAEIEAEFGPVVAAAVDAISERKGRETYLQYIQRCAQNPLAVTIKQADIADNLSAFRHAGLSPEVSAKMHVKLGEGLAVLLATAAV